jgi:hypothetical protein
MSSKLLCLNLGCGGRYISSTEDRTYINIDKHKLSLEKKFRKEENENFSNWERGFYRHESNGCLEEKTSSSRY